MQTFLPYPDFAASAGVLDGRRLGKQRVEALQILRALTRKHYGWKHHPAVRMWAGHEEALASYAMEICAEWVRRGHADTCAASICTDLVAAGPGWAQRRLPAGVIASNSLHSAVLLTLGATAPPSLAASATDQNDQVPPAAEDRQ